MRETTRKPGDSIAASGRGGGEGRSGSKRTKAARSGQGLAALAALVGALLASAPARADAPRAGAASDARRHEALDRVSSIDRAFKAGIDHYAAGRYQQAEEVFLRVWKVRRTYDVAANLGHTELRLGKVPEAATYLSFALRNWPVVGKGSPRELAQGRLAEAKAQIGTLVIRVDRVGAEVSINGARAGEAPLDPEVFVAPGTYRIEATLAGYEPTAATVKVGKGATRDVALAMRAAVSKRAMRTAIIVSGGVLSAAVIGVGVGLHAAGEAKADDVARLNQSIVGSGGSNSGDDPCLSSDDPRCAELMRAGVAGDAFRNVGTAMFVVGGAGLAATLTYWIWSTSRPEQRMGVRAAPVVSASGGGLGVWGSF